MIGTSTHDTKRGDDVRARIDVLSEIPDAWARAVRQWMRLNASARTTMADGPAPDRNDEYLFYQTLVGVWPPEAKDAPLPAEAPRSIVDRVMAYMQKAIKEAKIHTSWVSQDEAYETALRRFVERTLTGAGAGVPRRVSRAAASHREAWRSTTRSRRLALTIASPGVVDLYQGSELWDLSLVDPDNRRPVDFATRRDFLRELEPILTATDASRRAPVVTSLHDAWQDGRLKLFVLASLLRERRAQPSLFLEGSYEPLAGADDVSRRHIVAFARRHGRAVAIAAVPRLVRRLLANPFAPPLGEAVWGDSGILLPQDLGASSFVHVVTGEIIAPVRNGHGRVLPAADVFRTSPVALLVPR